MSQLGNWGRALHCWHLANLQLHSHDARSNTSLCLLASLNTTYFDCMYRGFGNWFLRLCLNYLDGEEPGDKKKRKVMSLTKNFVCYTYSQTQLYFTSVWIRKTN